MKFKEMLSKFWEGSFEHLDFLWSNIFISLVAGGLMTFTTLTMFAMNSLHAYWIFPIAFIFLFMFTLSVDSGCCLGGM